MPKVLIMDAKGVVTNGGLDVLKRHERYATVLKSLDQAAELVIISKCRESESINSSSLTIHCNKNILSFLLFSIKYLRNCDSNSLLVCGDPWESFLLTRLIQKLSKKRFPIQVQIHADVGARRWIFLNFKNLIRFVALLPTLKGATQIRCVSAKQLKNIENIIGKKLQNAVVIPVPIFVEPKLEDNQRKGNQQVVAFIGRIERDRGIMRALKIINLLNQSFIDLQVWIIGTGSQQKWLKSKLSKTKFADKVSFFGNISQDQLSKLWPSIGCLLSLAPSESYGRAVREALIHGVPVVALRTSGLHELEDDFKDKGLYYIEENNSNSEEVILRAFSSTVSDVASRKLLNDLNHLPQMLANSWLDLLDSKKFQH